MTSTEKISVKVRLSGAFTREMKVPSTLKMSDKARIVDVLDELGIPPDQVVVQIDGEPVPITRNIRKGDALEIVLVSSAG